MFNDHLSNEAAHERIAQRMKEVETYSFQKRLGYGEYGVTRWIFALIILMVAAVAVGLLF